jgi:hypothetical protein
MREILIAALCYVLPTFPLGFVWHLGPLKGRYRELGIYRENAVGRPGDGTGARLAGAGLRQAFATVSEWLRLRYHHGAHESR